MKPQPRYQPGDKIGGRYQVHQALMGGMGEVYLCLDLETIQPFALKTFQQRYQTGTQRLRQAFEKEVATWVALEKHPNIVRCFYMDIFDNQPFMVLEWIAGEEGRGNDLRGWLRHGPLDLQLALDLTIDVCRGLIHAQEKRPGLVHRDLKPENILIAQGRLAKVTDFGLAKVIQETGLELDAANVETDGRQRVVASRGIAGTPAYMAPEQWRREELDQRADIYALGCILYEMLTGEQPFQVDSVPTTPQRYQKWLGAMQDKHENGRLPVLPSDLMVGLPGLLQSCLGKRQTERLESFTALLDHLTVLYEQQLDRRPPTRPTRGQMTAVDYSNRGLTYYNLKRYEEALCDQNRAIELDPNDAKAYSNRGNTYSELQRHEEALHDHNCAIELDSNYAPLYSNRGGTYAALQRYDEALHDYNRAIELDPKDAIAYCNRGNTYDDLHRYEEALRDYDRAIELHPNYAVAYSYRANVFENLQRHEEALRDRSQAIELEPYYAPLYSNRGLTYQNLGHYEEALRDYNRAIELDSNLAQAYFNRGSAYRALQQYEVAQADYERAIELAPNFALAYLNMGALLVNIGQLHESLPYLEKAAQLGFPQASQTAAQIRQRLGTEPAPQIAFFQQAVEAFQQAGSAQAMQQAVVRFPYLLQADFIAAIEQLIAQQIPLEQRLAYEQQLVWLRQIANERK